MGKAVSIHERKVSIDDFAKSNELPTKSCDTTPVIQSWPEFSELSELSDISDYDESSSSASSVSLIEKSASSDPENMLFNIPSSLSVPLSPLSESLLLYETVSKTMTKIANLSSSSSTHSNNDRQRVPDIEHYTILFNHNMKKSSLLRSLWIKLSKKKRKNLLPHIIRVYFKNGQQQTNIDTIERVLLQNGFGTKEIALFLKTFYEQCNHSNCTATHCLKAMSQNEECQNITATKYDQTLPDTEHFFIFLFYHLSKMKLIWFGFECNNKEKTFLPAIEFDACDIYKILNMLYDFQSIRDSYFQFDPKCLSHSVVEKSARIREYVLRHFDVKSANIECTEWTLLYNALCS